MTVYIGHITAGIAGSTIASVVLNSGNVLAAGTLIVTCLGFVGMQLLRPRNGSRA